MNLPIMNQFVHNISKLKTTEAKMRKRLRKMHPRKRKRTISRPEPNKKRIVLHFIRNDNGINSWKVHSQFDRKKNTRRARVHRKYKFTRKIENIQSPDKDCSSNWKCEQKYIDNGPTTNIKLRISRQRQHRIRSTTFKSDSSSSTNSSKSINKHLKSFKLLEFDWLHIHRINLHKMEKRERKREKRRLRQQSEFLQFLFSSCPEDDLNDFFSSSDSSTEPVSPTSTVVDSSTFGFLLGRSNGRKNIYHCGNVNHFRYHLFYSRRIRRAHTNGCLQNQILYSLAEESLAEIYGKSAQMIAFLQQYKIPKRQTPFKQRNTRVIMHSPLQCYEKCSYEDAFEPRSTSTALQSPSHYFQDDTFSDMQLTDSYHNENHLHSTVGIYYQKGFCVERAEKIVTAPKLLHEPRARRRRRSKFEYKEKFNSSSDESDDDSYSTMPNTFLAANCWADCENLLNRNEHSLSGHNNDTSSGNGKETESEHDSVSDEDILLINADDEELF